MVHRIAVFMGTRPEAIKMAPVVRALQAIDGLEPIVVSTGQHREMLQQVVDLFEIPVHFDLDVMAPDQTLVDLPARLMKKVDAFLAAEKPNFALVQGDTTTEWSAGNLRKEGVAEGSIFVMGNTVIDALQLESTRHRRENFGGGLEQICSALCTLAKHFPDHRFIYLVHLNPHVRGPVTENLGNLPNVFLLKPMPYRSFVALMKHATVVLTDSGGAQEEAPGLGKPVLVMHDSTERSEGLEADTACLVGAEELKIVDGEASQRIAAAVKAWFPDEPPFSAKVRVRYNPRPW